MQALLVLSTDGPALGEVDDIWIAGYRPSGTGVHRAPAHGWSLAVLVDSDRE